MDDGHPATYIIFFIAFILIDFVFFGFGSAIQNVNSSQLEKDYEEGDTKAGRVLKIINKPARFINSIQIISILIGYINGGIMLSGIIRMAFDKLSINNSTLNTVLLYIAVYIVALIITVSFGIVIPKKIAQKNPKHWINLFLWFVELLLTIFLPIILAINLISYLVLKIFGVDMNKNEDNVTQEEIMSMVYEGHEQGVLESTEAKMITNIFELNDKEAEDIMVHRKNIIALDGNDMLSKVVDFMLNEGKNSRYPVYDDDFDNIIGTLNLKDALIYINKKNYKDRKLMEIPGLLREAHFIPETRSLDSLFSEMQSKKMHMVIVVDEYGQTSGIVTMEDILEEIVGNIMDEYDVDEEMITQLSDECFIVNGMAPLDEVKEQIGIEFTEEELDVFDTLNGFLISELDRIPADGEQFEINTHSYTFTVLHVQNKIIKSVKIVKNQIDSDENISNNIE